MLVHQAFRFELDPNNRTRAALSSHGGASRFAYNWGLALLRARLEQAEQVRRAAFRELLPDGDVERLARTVEVPWNLPALRKEWNREKAEAAPWWAANSKEAYSSGLDALARALEGWSKSRAGTRAGTVGFPRFKKKRVRKSCRFTTGAIRARDDRHVQLPRVGVVRVKEQTGELRELLDTGRARICSATISEQTGRWFVSFTCELERTDAPARLPDAVVGVDLGVKVLAALSTGELVANPKILGCYERKMARLSREQSRRQKGSKRRRQTRAELARCHARVANTGLNRAVLDVSPAELRRQLTYKLAWRGGTLVVADRFFPSSKRCSSCGETKTKLSLATRTYRCEHCGLETDRDLNAALNLAAYGRRVLEESHHVAGSGPETVNARGGGHPRHLPKPPVKR
ncbi:MAG: RNA-guided endonuclease TnpB family protein [Acidimicrobiales bacterium]